MTKFDLLAGTAVLLVAAAPAAAQTGATTSAQTTAPTNGPGQEATEAQTYGGIADVVVTAQRQSQRLQDVPIAVSAFTAENIEKQQITNPLALQQTLPNVTFTRTNFASSAFTIRGIGDLCVGVTCDSATGIHMNDQPLLGSQQLNNEFYDIERIEVLRGPQGTLFGRNATSGVVNIITAKPDLSGIHSAGEFEYGNFKSYRVKGMINLPLTDTIGVRVAGTYLNRDGYTHNSYTGHNIDGRDIWSVRGTLSWEPTSDTRIDLIGSYTREKDDRSRIQKQLCNRDPTGILGCLPDRLANGTTNFNSTLGGATESSQGLPIFAAQTIAGIQGLTPSSPAYAPTVLALQKAFASLGAFGFGNLYGADKFAGVLNDPNVRKVRVDYEPTWSTKEQIYTLKVFHDFGKIGFNLTAGYLKNSLDTTSDYNLAVENPTSGAPGLQTLAAVGANPASPFYQLAKTLIPNGANGAICQSDAGKHGVGVYGGETIGCYPQSLDFDRSTGSERQYSIEGHIDSSFDGPFNFLLGGIYFNNKAKDVDYYVNSLGLDYLSGLAGSFLASLSGGGNAFLASPSFHSNSDLFRLKSYGVFGEGYLSFSDRLKLTVGLRYNHDQKYVRARTTLDNALLPIGTTDANEEFNGGTVDFDPARTGIQPYAINRVKYSKLTGRAVLDYKITDQNLLYASYSRGYKSGGINPPLSPLFSVPTTFLPEQVDAIEIGSKNTFAHGALRLNLTGFYYKYKNLQLTRIVARTSVNDNIDANIYGVEAEAIISPVPAFIVNANFSYLKSDVTGTDFLVNPRDVSGGRADAVIVKDLAAAYNCAVVPTAAGTAATTRAFVDAINVQLGLNPSQPLLGNGTYGAFSSCNVLQASIGANPVQVLQDGVAVSIKGNQLPNAPMYKASVGAQYTLDLGSGGMTLVPRADLNFTGSQFGTIFNKNPIDRIQGYEVVNAQVQLNGRDDRWYLRGFVQNLTNNDSTTGLYVTDQSSGLFTNIFTIEPRRYGVAAGFKF